MNKIFKSIIILFWASFLFIFFKHELYNDGINKVTDFLNSYPKHSILLFFTLASLRIFTLIPCTIFIIIAGILFDPLQAFTLTSLANILSEILLFSFAKLTFGMNYQNRIVNKYPKIYDVVKKNNMQILALGVSSPVIPSDVVCFFSVLTGISFKKYVFTVFLASTPLILLYTFLGVSMKYSIYVFIITLIVITFISYINYKKWSKQIKK